MAGTDRTATEALALFRAIEEKPWKWSFYAALRRIESLYPDKPRIGETLRAADDPVRLGQDPSLAFAPSELASLGLGSDGLPPRLRVYFTGLFGPNGPLPLHLTEFARSREHNERDPTLGRFVDIFHHRLLSLMYRAWANAQPAVNADRPSTDRFAGYIGSFVGIGMQSLRGRDALGDQPKTYFAGHFSSGTRPAGGLAAICSEFFEVPVRIREFVGEWLALPRDSYLRLGQSRETGTLGQTAILGPRIWGCQHRFRIVAGPLDYRAFRRFLPGRGGLQRLAAAVRMFVGDEMSWDLQLILQPAEVPSLQLGRGGYLGRTSWLHSNRRSRPADDAVLRVSRNEAMVNTRN